MVDGEVRISTADVSRVMAMCERLQRECGKSAVDSARWGVINILQRLRTRTPKAPQRRKVRQITRPGAVKWGKLGQYEYTRYANGIEQRKTFWAADISAAKESRKLLIGRWGLAKRSWMWFASELFGDRGRQPAGPKAQITAKMVWSRITNDANAGKSRIELENRLEYIEKIAGGQVAGAVAAAERRMEHNLRKRMERMGLEF